MSVVDSQVDRDQAVSRLAEATPESLDNDLRFWTVASHDAAAEYSQLHERMGAVRRQHNEAETWIALIAQELRSRRDARLADRPPAQD
jgi:hypothetical protein